MLENYEKEKEKQNNPEGKKAWEPSLKEILSKPEGGYLFGELLDREGRQDLAEKLAQGEISESDIQEFDHYRKNYNESMDRAEVVKASIDDKLIEAYTRNNPDLQEVVGLIGQDSYTRMIKEKLTTLAIKDPYAFDRLASSVESKNDFMNSDYKKLDDEVLALCEKKNIEPKKYMEALAIADPKERQKAIKELAKESVSWYGQALTFGQLGRNRTKLMSSKKNEIEAMLSDVRSHQDNVGGFLGGLVSNEDVRSAVAAELVGDKLEKVEKLDFKEAKGNLWDEAELQKNWETSKKTHDFDAMSPQDQEEFRTGFIDYHKDGMSGEYKKKTGFWGSIFSSFFDSFITSSKSRLN